MSPKGDPGLIKDSTSLESEVHLGSELYSLRLTPLPPTFLSPDGGTILTMTSLHTREERDRARAEALAFITHELRTPLTSIQGFAELMMHYPRSTSSQSAPDTIFRESKRLLAMINSYLNVLRLDAGAQSLQATPLDIEALVKQVFDVLQPLADANGMRLVLRSGPAPVPASGDATLITGAILNLVSNAIKYGKPETDIEVSYRGQNNETIISVRPGRRNLAHGKLGAHFRTLLSRSPCPEGLRRLGTGIGLRPSHCRKARWLCDHRQRPRRCYLRDPPSCEHGCGLRHQSDGMKPRNYTLAVLSILIALNAAGQQAPPPVSLPVGSATVADLKGDVSLHSSTGDLLTPEGGWCSIPKASWRQEKEAYC